MRAAAARASGLGAMALMVVLWGWSGCIEKDPAADDDTTDIVDECPDPWDGELEETYDEIYNPDGIWREHAPPKPGVLCYDCHLCADHGAEPIDNTHFVCNHCHDGETGELNETGSDCGCGDLDCETDPPILTCGNCHTDGCNGMIPADVMNGECDFCHVDPEGDER